MKRNYYYTFYHVMFEYFVATILSNKEPTLRFNKFFKFKGVHVFKGSIKATRFQI